MTQCVWVISSTRQIKDRIFSPRPATTVAPGKGGTFESGNHHRQIEHLSSHAALVRCPSVQLHRRCTDCLAHMDLHLQSTRVHLPLSPHDRECQRRHTRQHNLNQNMVSFRISHPGAVSKIKIKTKTWYVLFSRNIHSLLPFVLPSFPALLSPGPLTAQAPLHLQAVPVLPPKAFPSPAWGSLPLSPLTPHPGLHSLQT